MIHKYKTHLRNRGFRVSAALSFIFLAFSLIVNYYAGIYATDSASNSVTDLVLNNIPTYDVDGIFVYGALMLVAFIAWLCFVEPKRIPFILKSIALFYIIRSIFISLTHIAAFPTQIAITSKYVVTESIISKFFLGGDLFFSGHTGLPFLMALIFWQNEVLRYVFITVSLMFGTIVLLGHLHYSIDVLSAFFITFSIYHLAEKFFKKDHTLFLQGVQD